jgi:hypothetical protein
MIKGLEAIGYLCVVWSYVPSLTEHFIKKVVCFVMIKKHGMEGVMSPPQWGDGFWMNKKKQIPSQKHKALQELMIVH